MGRHVFLIFLLTAGMAPAHAGTGSNPQVCVQGACVDVEVVSTAEDMMRGLQGRMGLGKDRGMLFVFKADGVYPFWMKDMRFPIDILWLDAGSRLVHISPSVPACTGDPCPTYAPGQPVRYVLEVESGYAARHGLKAGAGARLNNLPLL